MYKITCVCTSSPSTSLSYYETANVNLFQHKLCSIVLNIFMWLLL